MFPNEKVYYYYITNQSGDQLLRMERASKRKVVVEAVVQNYINGIPDSVNISHKKFDFTIALKRIER